ncbi:MAG TPA: hypothetical protein PKA06_14995, partial [Gemmatales bacterium]|nr:hypothetical protein [Gemmatales bacterium]
KYTLVVGTFFLLASLISVLRQSGYMELNVEVPVLFIIFGILLLLSQHPGVPFPAWYSPPADKK